METKNVWQAKNRQEKVRRLTAATETMLARLGVTNFAAPGLAELIASWPADMWTMLSTIAKTTICAGAPSNGRVCPECIAAVVADFRERPVLAAALQRMGVQ